MDMTPENLDEIGIRFGTDKSSTGHDYLNFYERFFAPIRNKSLKILEIGVFEGASLSVWEQYFPNATIVGADINISTVRFAKSRVQIEIADQSNLEDLVSLGTKYGPFDIVIDDGSHVWDHQITSLRTLFPFVRNGGIYIIEDLQTNYGEMQDDYRGVSSISCMEYLKHLVDLRVSDHMTNISEEEDAFLRTYGRAVRSVVFYKMACLIEKELPDLGTRFLRTPYIEADDADPSPVVLVGHVGGIGDHASATGYIRPRDAGSNMQGFFIKMKNPADCDLQYRARLADGNWTAWVGEGEFVGTRGRREDLTGFSVRITGKDAQAFQLEAVGEFPGEPSPVVVREGEDCVPRYGQGPLAGMQISLRRKAA